MQNRKSLKQPTFAEKTQTNESSTKAKVGIRSSAQRKLKQSVSV